MAWTQVARITDEVHFAVYVDERRRVELSAACTASGATTRNCESPVPPLTEGRHSLELVAWVGSAQQPTESARSAALIVRVMSEATAASREPPTPFDCGLVATPGHELVMWDSSGIIRAMDIESQRFRTWRSADSEPESSGWVLSGLASHSDFARNGWIYVAEISRDQSPLLRISRYRKKADVLGERVVIFRQALTKRPFRVRLSAVRDRLYVALLAAPDPASESPAPQPFLIRLTADGRLPAGSDSVFAATVAARPVEVVWLDDGGLPWVIEQTGGTRYTLAAGGGLKRPSHFATTSPPIAARLDASGGQPTLWIALSQGDLLRFHDSVVGWVLSPQGSETAASRTTRDAVPVGTGEMAFCGPADASTKPDPAAQMVWRRRLRN